MLVWAWRVSSVSLACGVCDVDSALVDHDAVSLNDGLDQKPKDLMQNE